MKKGIVITLIILVSGGLINGIPQFRARIIKALSYSECDTPIPYKLGEIDPKFGLKQATAISNIQDASDIWSNNYGKELFVNSPTAKLTINFVYDQRSALNLQINKQQTQIFQKDSGLKKKSAVFEADVAAFEKKLAGFNDQVNQINRSGGAGLELYNSLIAQQNALNQEGNTLNARAKELNLSVHDYNSNIQSLNQNINQFNQSLAQKPEEGLYDGGNNTITIYFVNNHQELIHTLAHEFGHAMGMPHTDDPQSLMNHFTSSFLSVTSQDKQQLAYVCREQLLPDLWLRQLATWLREKSTILHQVVFGFQVF